MPAAARWWADKAEEYVGWLRRESELSEGYLRRNKRHPVHAELPPRWFDPFPQQGFYSPGGSSVEGRPRMGFHALCNVPTRT